MESDSAGGFDDDNQIKLCSNRSGSIDSGKGAN